MSRLPNAMLLLAFIQVLWVSPSTAQNNLSEISGFSYQARNWPPSSSSPASIFSIAQTPDGYLWLANEYGLYKFDGIHFNYLNGSNSKIFKYMDCGSLYLASDSTLLAGFSKGLVLAYKNRQWRTLDSESVFMNRNITAISEDSDHNLWFGIAGGGVIRYNRKTAKVFSVAEGMCDNEVNVICPGKEGEVWIGTDKGLCLIGRDEVKVYNSSQGLSHLNINGLCIDPEGTLWIGSSDGFLFFMRKGVLQEYKGTVNIIRSSIKQISAFGPNILTIATEGQGLILLNTVSGKTEIIDSRRGLASNLILTVFLDREKNLWAGTQASGLSRVMAVPVQMINKGNGLSGDCITAIVQSADGTIWTGNAAGGIDRIKDGRVENLGSRTGLGKLPVYSIAIDKKNNAWFGSLKSLIRFDGQSSKAFGQKQGFNCTYFHALLATRDGSLWVGTDQGIFIMKDEHIVSVLTTREGMPSNKIFCFLEDRKGNVWVGTQDGGLARVTKGKITSYGEKQGLADNMILCLYLDSLDNIWIGTGQNGLFHMNTPNESISHAADRQLMSSIGYIFNDGAGNLWLAGSGGLAAVKFSILSKSLQSGSFNIHPYWIGYDTAIGFYGMNTGLFPGACRLSNGQLWFPCTGGIAIINPLHSQGWNYSPVPLIDSVRVNSNSSSGQERYEVGAGMMRLEINYTAPSFIHPEELTFRYRLVGFDKDWDSVGSRRTAYYTNVPPGDYTFEVQVFNHVGDLSPGTATVKIHVLPFFYQTWWFITLCVFAALILISLGINYRIRYIREKELEALVSERTEEIRKLNEQLEQKVTDRTAQLEAANKELEAFSYSVSHDLKGPVRRIDAITRAFIEDYFSTLDDTEKDFLKKITESANSMNLLIDELLKLSRIVRHDIDKMQVNISEIAQEINNEIRKMHPGRKVRVLIHEGMLEYCDPKLLRIAFQNLFDNAWKYSGKEKDAVIEFNRTVKDGKSVYLVRDNGVGFDMAYYDKLFTPFQRLHSDDQFTGTGIGLATVKRIILKHGGLIWAESSPGEGTTFYFTLDAANNNSNWKT